MRNFQEFIFLAKQAFLSDFPVCRNAPSELRLKCFSGLVLYLDILEKSISCELTSNTSFGRKKIWKNFKSKLKFNIF